LYSKGSEIAYKKENTRAYIQKLVEIQAGGNMLQSSIWTKLLRMAFQILGCCLSNRNLKYSALE
jgi:hypothetical protein